MVPIPEIKPEFFGAAVCGLTASIGLDKAGRLKQGEKVLITAAAGGVGMCSLFVYLQNGLIMQFRTYCGSMGEEKGCSRDWRNYERGKGKNVETFEM